MTDKNEPDSSQATNGDREDADDADLGPFGMVVGVDGSPGGERALLWAAARTGQFGEIQPVSTWHFPWWMLPNPFPGPPAPPPSVQFQSEVEQQARRIIDALAIGECRPPIVRRASAGLTLVALGSHANLIVVGTRGRGAVTDTLLGSVSAHVVSHATVPVAIVPAHVVADDPIARIVVGVDGSDNSLAALVWAMEMAPEGATIDAVHAWQYAATGLPESYSIPSEVFALAAERVLDDTITKALTRTAGPRREITRRIHNGDPRTVLRELSATADLLVLGAQGKHGLAHLLLGSTTTGLIHQPLSVTVVVPLPR